MVSSFKVLSYELITPKVPQILNMDVDRRICFATNIKGIPCILLRPDWPGSDHTVWIQNKIWVTSENTNISCNGDDKYFWNRAFQWSKMETIKFI